MKKMIIKIFFILALTSFFLGCLILIFINPITSTMSKYYEKTKLPIFIEWICLEENMTIEHAKELIKIMKKVPSKLNLIEFNPLKNKDFKPANQESIDKFSKIIQDNGFLSLFRKSRGRDINASCGSLANKKI